MSIICGWCDQDMQAGVSCVDNGTKPWNGSAACHDCATPAGGFHHPGCDMELCPDCGRQIIACGCQLEEV